MHKGRGTCNCSLIDGTNLYKLLSVDLDELAGLVWKTVSTFFIRSVSSLDDVNTFRTCIRNTTDRQK